MEFPYPILAYKDTCDKFSYVQEVLLKWPLQPREAAFSTPRVCMTIASFLSGKPLLALTYLRLICKPCGDVSVHKSVLALRPDLSNTQVTEIVQTDKRNVAPWLIVYRATGVIVVPANKPLSDFCRAVWILAQTKDNRRVMVHVTSDGLIDTILPCSVSGSASAGRRYSPLLGSRVTLRKTSSNYLLEISPLEKWVIVKHAFGNK
jgi:hypothetical protein